MKSRRPLSSLFDYLLDLPGIHYMATRCAGDRIAGFAYNARHRSSWKSFPEAPEVITLIADLLGENKGRARFVLFGCGKAKLIHGLNLDDFHSIACIDLSDAALAEARKEFGSIPKIAYEL